MNEKSKGYPKIGTGDWLFLYICQSVYEQQAGGKTIWDKPAGELSEFPGHFLR